MLSQLEALSLDKSQQGIRISVSRSFVIVDRSPHLAFLDKSPTARSRIARYARKTARFSGSYDRESGYTPPMFLLSPRAPYNSAHATTQLYAVVLNSASDLIADMGEQRFAKIGGLIRGGSQGPTIQGSKLWEDRVHPLVRAASAGNMHLRSETEAARVLRSRTVEGVE